ncbi:hypothetical protein TcasGA2_TC032891 [Tribolium castaneum]|uniref:Salivary secreted peptide n=1 Tax=Tribolium castaneum TaxID=7070 RepID=A0A139WJW9_TRICA|nr:hypothetical protein TcasGA2_TC032891 [Tribolium castaneum]
MFYFLCLVLFVSNYVSCNVSTNTTTTAVPVPDYPSINCDYFPKPEQADEGNYGDGICSIGEYPNERPITTKILTTNDGDTHLSHQIRVSGYAVTRVKLLNFGRYHGATNAISISNHQGTASVEVHVDIFSKKGIRMVLELYGL